VIGLCASTGALKLDPLLDKRTRMKHIIDTVRAFLLMVGRKEPIELRSSWLPDVRYELTRIIQNFSV
jgi:hypothetical protein